MVNRPSNSPLAQMVTSFTKTAAGVYTQGCDSETDQQDGGEVGNSRARN